MPTTKATRRHFTDAARAAAIEARRVKREVAPPKGRPEVFVVRRTGVPFRFAWEVRRFGSIVLGHSADDYASPHDARAAGERALAGLGNAG